MRWWLASIGLIFAAHTPFSTPGSHAAELQHKQSTWMPRAATPKPFKIADNRNLNGGFCWASSSEKLTNFCGGDPKTGSHDISCSPFNYRPFLFNILNRTPNPCGGSHYEDIVAGAQNGQGARAWGAFDGNGNNIVKDYWVFHNCDGAGIQPDCAGDIKYIERLEGTNTEPNCTKGSHGRNHCTFTHPDSGTTFGQFKYWAGWYGNGQITEDDCKSQATGNWGGGVCDKIAKIENPYENDQNRVQGPGGAFSFMLFPWVCEADSNMVGSNFVWPTMSKWKTTTGWKCYADNEPGTKDVGWPPYIEIWLGGLYKEGNTYTIRLDKWMVNNSDTPVKMGQGGYKIYPCNANDKCPW